MQNCSYLDKKSNKVKLIDINLLRDIYRTFVDIEKKKLDFKCLKI